MKEPFNTNNGECIHCRFSEKITYKCKLNECEYEDGCDWCHDNITFKCCDGCKYDDYPDKL